MSFKFLKTVARVLVLSAVLLSNVANAGLIVNGNEWLDMSVTSGMSRAQVEGNILTLAQYSEYEYASDIMLRELYNQMVGTHFNSADTISGWNTISNFSEEEREIANWFMSGGTSAPPFGIFDIYKYGAIATATITTTPLTHSHMGGWFNIQLDIDTNSYYVYDRSSSDQWNLGTQGNIHYGNITSVEWMHHALVRKIDVPEPSTLAIFALGMIGLASSRFKKQS